MNKPSRSVTNFVASIAVYGVSLAIGLAYTPFLVRSLGVEAYGLIPLSFAIVQYSGLVTQSASQIINQRLVAARDDVAAYNRQFSTSFWLCASVALCVTLVWLVVSEHLPSFIDLPPRFAAEAPALFLAVAAASVISILNTPLVGAIFSDDALYLVNFSQGIESAARVLIVVALFNLAAPSLTFVACGVVIASFLGLALLSACAGRLRPSLRLGIRHFDPVIATGMLRSSGGAILTSLGTLLFLNADLYIVNRLHGPEIGGAYAAAAQWAVVLRGLALSVAGPVTAQIMHAYHKRERVEFIALVCRSIRLLTAFAALPVGYLAGVAPDLLNVWLGPSVAVHWPILTMLAAPMAVHLAAIPLTAVAVAANKITPMGWCQGVAGAGFVAAAIGAGLVVDWDGTEVAAVLGVALLLRNWLCVIPYVGRLVGGATGAFFLASLLPIVWTACAAVSTYLLARLIEPRSYLDLAEVGLLIAGPYAYVVALTSPKEDLSLVKRELMAAMAAFNMRRVRASVSGPR